MPTSIVELNQFVEFATGVLNSGAAEASIEQLLKQWRERREAEEVENDYRIGIQEYEAGLGMSVKEAFADVRKRLGITE